MGLCHLLSLLALARFSQDAPFDEHFTRVGAPISITGNSKIDAVGELVVHARCIEVYLLTLSGKEQFANGINFRYGIRT